MITFAPDRADLSPGIVVAVVSVYDGPEVSAIQVVSGFVARMVSARRIGRRRRYPVMRCEAIVAHPRAVVGTRVHHGLVVRAGSVVAIDGLDFEYGCS